MTILRNHLLESSINRFGEIREDLQKVTEIFAQKESKIILVHKGRFICQSSQIRFFSYSDFNKIPMLKDLANSMADAKEQNTLPNDTLYLGQFNFQIEESRHLFVLTLSPTSTVEQNFELLDARSLSFSSSAELLELIFYVQGLVAWHFTHPFCAKCGNKSKASHSGHSRKCISSSCNKQHFPRIEPAVIFSICRNAQNEQIEDKILLARQSSWPEKRYSVLAGFAEHGESLEQSVAREAYEEVGIKVNKIRYLGSQPWPFPASLMIGFSSETKDEQIRLLDQELETARWFSAKELKSEIESGKVLAPFSISISWKIIEHWYQQQTGHSLKSINKPNERTS